MKLTPNFYRDRVCLNVLAGSKDNARENYDAAEGHVLVGVLSKNYPDVASAVADMRDYARCSRSTSTRSSPAWLPAARCSGRTRRWSTAWSLPPVRREWLRSPPTR